MIMHATISKKEQGGKALLQRNKPCSKEKRAGPEALL
jgi:hypothetical protein